MICSTDFEVLRYAVGQALVFFFASVVDRLWERPYMRNRSNLVVCGKSDR